MSRFSHHVLIIALVLSLLSVPTLAGSQASPEVSDPADDVVTTGGDGPLDDVLGEDVDFSNIDLIAAWFDEPDAATVALTIETAAEVPADGTLAASFTVNQGPTSVFGSNATGSQVDLVFTGGAGSGVGNATQAGPLVTFTFSRADVGASGGDILGDLIVSSSRTQGPPADCPAGCNPTTGTDRAPDAGSGLNFTLARPDVVPGAVLALSGGMLSVNGTTIAIGNTANTTFVNGTATWDVTLSNSGSDVDTFTIDLVTQAALLAGGVEATLDGNNATLDPGANHVFQLNATFTNATFTTHGFALLATSQNGATGAAAATLEIIAPPEPEPEVEPPTEEEEPPAKTSGREPVLAVGFLTDLAESSGLDDAFGDWAEVVLVALTLLVLVVLLFLILALAGSRWLKVSVTPKRISAAPGETAEFQVHVRNKKKRYSDALAYFDGDADWNTGVLLSPEGSKKALTRPGSEARMGIGGRKDPDGEFDGTLRVKVPADALNNESDKVTLNVVPLDGEGAPLDRKGGHAKVTVRAVAPVAAKSKPATGGHAPSTSVRLANVDHNPVDPAPETEVMTTATIENDSQVQTARLRVVLQLEGVDAEEQIVEVPPRSARAVRFPWIAEDGSNKVRVQIYEA